MSYFPTGNVILSGNSTTTALDDSDVFTGSAVDVSRFSSVVFAVLTDTETVVEAQFSPDAINWDSSLTYNIAANLNDVHRLTITRRYFRLVITNSSGGNQTFLRAQSMAGEFPQLAAPSNLPMQQDADTIITRTIDPQLDLASGKLSGHVVRNKFGKNSDIDTGTIPEDVWETGGVYTGFPTGSAETLELLSSSTDDAAAGIGARTVTLFGLDGDYNNLSETITLNGTTGVNSTGNFLRVHTMFVATAGSNDFNVGTITVRHSTTTANVFLNMQPGRNQTNCAGYTIPANTTGYLKKVHAAIQGSNSANVDGALWIRTFGNPPRLRRPFTFAKNDRLIDEIYGGLRLAEKTDIIMRITSVSANNISLTGGYDIILVDN